MKILRLNVKWKTAKFIFTICLNVNNRNGEAINPLKDIKNLKKVYIDYGALEWPSGYGLHGDTIVRDGKLVDETAA